MADFNRAQREHKLRFAEAAHQAKPNVPLSWLWLLEWASGLSILYAPKENKHG
jgi:hypothetical protein